MSTTTYRYSNIIILGISVSVRCVYIIVDDIIIYYIIVYNKTPMML